MNAETHEPVRTSLSLARRDSTITTSDSQEDLGVRQGKRSSRSSRQAPDCLRRCHARSLQDRSRPHVHHEQDLESEPVRRRRCRGHHSCSSSSSSTRSFLLSSTRDGLVTMIRVQDHTRFDIFLCFLCIKISLLRRFNFLAFLEWDEQITYSRALILHVIIPTRALS